MKREINELNEIYSVSSCENVLNKYLKSKYINYCDEIVEDRLYSVFAHKKCNSDVKLMIACAMDEIGLMISDIEDDGKIRFISLEPLSSASLLHQRVVIINRNNEYVKGIISLNSKFMENKLGEVNIEDLYIDTFSNALDINIGDLVSLDSEIVETNDYIVGRSLNQKIPQFLTIDLLKEIHNKCLNYNLYMGAIAQSTVGFRGTKTANYVVKPEFAIVITGFEVNASLPKISLNDGVIIGYYDSQMLPNQELVKYICKNYKTKAYLGQLGNDGSFIHKTLNGAKCISVGIPMKNMGTPNVIVSKNDIQDLKQLLLSLIDDKNFFEFLERI